MTDSRHEPGSARADHHLARRAAPDSPFRSSGPRTFIARALWGVFLLLFSAAVFPAPIAGTTPLAVDEPDAYAVYAAVLPDEWLIKEAKAHTIVVRQETGTMLDRCVPFGPAIEPSWKEALDDFRRANASPRTVLEGFELGIPYVVASAAEIDTAMRQVPGDPGFGFTGFRQRFPESGGGYFVFSAVGFDAGRQRAIVYIEHDCGMICGSGDHYMLRKIGSDWHKVTPLGASPCAWES